MLKLSESKEGKRDLKESLTLMAMMTLLMHLLMLRITIRIALRCILEQGLTPVLKSFNKIPLGRTVLAIKSATEDGPTNL
ncbi:hypothetical protein VNO77_33235 [Canavalia gladiata]|uniref:Uncharacterized protein n=1 Tax=Canavalia gladiata TaxID=3824 RepID=A0AAN9KDH8_CANGL